MVNALEGNECCKPIVSVKGLGRALLSFRGNIKRGMILGDTKPHSEDRMLEVSLTAGKQGRYRGGTLLRGVGGLLLVGAGHSLQELLGGG